MKGTSSELLINLDTDGIARIFLAQSNNNRARQLTDLFGDTAWKSEFETGGDLRDVLVLVILSCWTSGGVGGRAKPAAAMTDAKREGLEMF